MTTYRRLFCNDILRFGPLDLESNTTTYYPAIYMKSMGLWPGACHAAITAGSKLAGYVLGNVSGTGEETNGMLTVISLRYMDMIDVVKQLSDLLEDCCDKTYGAYTMRYFSSNNYFDKYISNACGYVKYRCHPVLVELWKPLPLSEKMIEEKIRKKARRSK